MITFSYSNFSLTLAQLITFENGLDTDQAQHLVGPYLNPNCLWLWWYSQKRFEKLILKIKSAEDKKNPVGKLLIWHILEWK